MPPNEPCPHCGTLILDWHNEWYEGAQRGEIYRGQAAMDCPICRKAVLWFESRDLAAPPVNVSVTVYLRSSPFGSQPASTWLVTSPIIRRGNRTAVTGRQARFSKQTNR